MRIHRSTAVKVHLLGLSLLLGAGCESSISATPPASPVPASPAAVEAPISQKVYTIDFGRGDRPGDEWSVDHVATTPDNMRRFLGPLDEKQVTLSLDRLPPHQFVRVRFLMLLYDRWNGDSQIFGRDVWDFRVVDGQPLLHTTFSNCGFFNNNNEQSFPDQYPWYPTHPAWTGAATKQTLGWRTGQETDTWGCDSQYDLDLTFPHVGKTLQLAFQSQIKQHEDKPYGFVRMRVDCVSGPAHLDPILFDTAWTTLAGDNAETAFTAAWQMIATGDAATAYIADHLPKPADAAPAPVKVPMDRDWTPDQFQYNTPASRQLARALHVLEVIHTPAAMKLLDQFGVAPTPVGAPPDQWR